MRKFLKKNEAIQGAESTSVDTSAVVRPSALPAGHKYSGNADVEAPQTIIRQGLAVVVIFFGVLGLWAIFAEISGAIVAQGRIKIETERKTVQHLEGGIVDAILVREGDTVKEGQPLLVLESVQVEASENMLLKQVVSLRAAQMRLMREKLLENTLVWPEDLREKAETIQSLDVLDNEAKLFRARANALQGQISLLDSQVDQVESQVAGFEEQIRAEKTIIGTLHEELKAKRQLYKERYLEKSQILELERTLATHEGNRGRMRQSVAESHQKSAELKLRIEDAKNRFVEDASRELSKVENELLQVRERIRPLKDARRRLQVLAPVSGTVVGLKVHSKGGVVRPGEPLLDIVPQDNPLIADTRVPVNKITEVFIGQDAQVQMDAFDTRVVPHIPAKVQYISADSLEEQTNAGPVPYYLCYVEIDPKELEKANLYLSPGMPVTVFITTKKRTVLYYMMEPLLKNWERALRD